MLRILPTYIGTGRGAFTDIVNLALSRYGNSQTPYCDFNDTANVEKGPADKQIRRAAGSKRAPSKTSAFVEISII